MSVASEIGMIPQSMWGQIPAAKPPPGQQNNLINPTDQGPSFIAGASVLYGIMLLFFGIRVYVKGFIIRRINWDDFTCFIGLLVTTVLYGSFVVSCGQGPLGKHMWDTSLAEVSSRNFLIPSYLWVVIINLPLWFVKLTFFLMYLQIFWPMRWLRISVYIGAGVISAFYIAVTVAQFVIATPSREESWFVAEASPRFTVRAKRLSIPISAVGLAIDIFLLVLPIRAVTQLKLPNRRKIGVLILFATGGLACLGSLLSVYFRTVDKHSIDSTWNIAFVEIMLIMEICIGITCASLPCVSKMIRHHSSFFESLRSSFASKFSLLGSRKGVKHSDVLPVASTPSSKESYEMVQGEQEHEKLGKHITNISNDRVHLARNGR